MITKYNKPSMKFYEFAAEDIITVSGREASIDPEQEVSKPITDIDSVNDI
ncbi:MAG: hypothetical protein K2F81_04515 [Ruminococcus sp.]|nr:hypothetical protein [Ruminococcus sp.]